MKVRLKKLGHGNCVVYRGFKWNKVGQTQEIPDDIAVQAVAQHPTLLEGAPAAAKKKVEKPAATSVSSEEKMAKEYANKAMKAKDVKHGSDTASV